MKVYATFMKKKYYNNRLFAFISNSNSEHVEKI